jgi:hypothetical protein
MKEAPYTSSLSNTLEKLTKGKVLKISDRSTLGLPDCSHIKDSIVTYIETKVEDRFEKLAGEFYVQPWLTIKKDLRQFEVCKEISKKALVLYAIYYPKIKHSCILGFDEIAQLRETEDGFVPYLNPKLLIFGHGAEDIVYRMKLRKEELYATLVREYGPGFSS